METRQYWWVFDRTLWDQIRLPEFSLLEGMLILATLAGLGAYLGLIVWLDRRSKRKRRREKRLAWLARWLEHARLSPGELEQVDRLAGAATPQARLGLLGDAVRFETRVHDAVAAGWGGGLSVVGKAREKLRFGSDNLRAPVVSTRQLLSGDAVRVVIWREGLPHHYYGKVGATDNHHFSATLRAEAVREALAEGAPLEVFFLRGQGLEYRFSCRPAGTPGQAPGQLALEHALASVDHLPRNARLPLLLPISFRERAFNRAAGAAPPPRGPPPPAPGRPNPEPPMAEPPMAEPPKAKGLVLDLSEGGFSLAHAREIAPGHFIEFHLPLKKGRVRPLLTGKVLECRPFSGGQWLSRCELRGISGTERDLLHQVVRLEQANRMKVLAPVRRRSAKAG